MVSPRVLAFHRNLRRYATRTASVDEHGRPDAETVNRLEGAGTIFVYTHELSAFIQHVWPRLGKGPYVLVTHNSDEGVDARHLPFLDEAGSRLRRWFAQNLDARHPKLTPLPIGIANSMWPHGDLRVLRRAVAAQARRRKDRLVFLDFNPRTYEPRRRVWETLRQSFPELSGEAPTPRPFRAYLEDMARHRFSVCPRGNGIDTHRVWESLYLGVVPIVERSVHTELWSELGLPIVLVSDWAEVTPTFLEELEPPRVDSRHYLLRLTYFREVLGSQRYGGAF